MQKYQDSVILQNAAGATSVGSGLTATVYNIGTTTLATIYSDNGVTVVDQTLNPLVTDTNGFFSFYAANGHYTLVISGTGITPFTRSDILFEDMGTILGTNYAEATGTVDALAGTFPLSSLVDGFPFTVHTLGSNTITNPTFAPTVAGILQVARVIKKFNTAGVLVALELGDICGGISTLRYDSVNLIYTLENPARVSTVIPYTSNTLPANMASVQAAIALSMATVPLANMTGGVYNFGCLGTGATFIYTVGSGVITAISSVVAGGTGYAVGDIVTVSAGNYDSYVRVLTVSAGAISTVTLLYGGTGYTAGIAVATQASVTTPFSYTLAGVLTSNATVIVTAGTRITQSNQFAFANNTTGAFTVTVLVSNGAGGSTGTGVVLVRGVSNNTLTLLSTDGVVDIWQLAVNKTQADAAYAGLAGLITQLFSAKAGTDTGYVVIRDQLRTLIPVTHLITSGTGIYYPDYIFNVPTACNATVGATYTNNGQTFTVRATVASSLMVIMSSASATLPTVSGTLTKATGTGDATITFDSMAYPIAYKVKMVGGGAGGSGSGSGGTGGAGGSGGTTAFGAMSANGAIGGGYYYTSTGGTASIGAAAFIGLAITGGSSGGGSFAAISISGGDGASSPLGGNGAAAYATAGSAAIANSGSGGGGAGASGTATYGGSGGGSGGYIEAITYQLTPGIGYTYSVGALGAAGTAGTSGYAGGNGGSGLISVEQYYG